MARLATAAVRIIRLWLAQNWALLIVCGVLLTAFCPLYLGRMYAVGDMRDLFIPLEHFFHSEVIQGRLPLWHPDVAWGYPVAASAQIGFFYPPLLLLRWLPLAVYLPITLLSHGLLLATGMFVWLRRSGHSQSAAIFGSIAFGLSAFIWQHLPHLNIFLAAAWLPWQLIVAESLARNRQVRVGQILTYIIVVAIPFLAGQLQIPAYLAGFSSLYLLYEYARRHRRAVRPILIIVGSALITLALTSVQLLPTLEIVPLSSRGPEGDFDLLRANQHSFPVYHLPTVLFPRFFGHEYSYWGKRLEIEYGAFIGTLPLILAVLALTHWRRNVAIRFWASVGTISLLLALGSSSPFRLLGIEPSLWLFSAPARWLLFTTLAGAVLAAHGFDLLGRPPRYWRTASIAIAATLVIGVLIGNGIIAAASAYIPQVWSVLASYAPDLVGTKPEAYYLDKLAGIVTSMRATSISLLSPYTALPLIAAIILPLTRYRQYGRTLLLLVTVVELLTVTLFTTSTAPWSSILAAPSTLTALPVPIQQGEARIFSTRFGGDTGAYFTDPESRGTPATHAQLKRLLVPLMHAQFGVAGVEWSASLDIWAHYKKLEKLRGDFGYVIEDDALAHDLNIGAVLLPADSVAAPDTDVIQVDDVIIQPRSYAPRAEVVNTHDQSVGHVTYESLAPRHLRLAVMTSEAARVVVRDSWYPGWQAWVDGQPTVIERYHDIFRAVDVPAGAHTIEMRFRPRSYVIGLSLSLVTASGLAALFLHPRVRRFTV